MIAIPNERLRERAHEKVMGLELAITQTAFADSRAELEEELELARIALASLEAEPVITVGDDGGDALAYRRLIQTFAPGTKLFTAHPAPVSVMDEAQSRELFEKNCMANIERNKWHPDLYAHLPAREQWAAWEACRAAMLQGADGNSPVIPDGWVACSERMPERDVDVQVYCADKKEQMVGYMERNERDGYFRFASLPNGGGVYCQPTHWMPLPAAPQQEAKNV